MSERSFKKAKQQRQYRERAQPKERKKVGFLEHKKDWLVRLRDHQKKKKHLQNLKDKAFFKNPDEFYFKMIKKKVRFKQG
jgi:U3 small nucleolar RNA-associated protein 11